MRGRRMLYQLKAIPTVGSWSRQKKTRMSSVFSSRTLFATPWRARLARIAWLRSLWMPTHRCSLAEHSLSALAQAALCKVQRCTTFVSDAPLLGSSLQCHLLAQDNVTKAPSLQPGGRHSTKTVARSVAGFSEATRVSCERTPFSHSTSRRDRVCCICSRPSLVRAKDAQIFLFPVTHLVRVGRALRLSLELGTIWPRTEERG